jgi:hypothetical protein
MRKYERKQIKLGIDKPLMKRLQDLLSHIQEVDQYQCTFNDLINCSLWEFIKNNNNPRTLDFLMHTYGMWIGRKE